MAKIRDDDLPYLQDTTIGRKEGREEDESAVIKYFCQQMYF